MLPFFAESACLLQQLCLEEPAACGPHASTKRETAAAQRGLPVLREAPSPGAGAAGAGSDRQRSARGFGQPARPGPAPAPQPSRPLPGQRRPNTIDSAVGRRHLSNNSAAASTSPRSPVGQAQILWLWSVGRWLSGKQDGRLLFSLAQRSESSLAQKTLSLLGRNCSFASIALRSKLDMSGCNRSANLWTRRSLKNTFSTWCLSYQILRLTDLAFSPMGHELQCMGKNARSSLKRDTPNAPKFTNYDRTKTWRWGSGPKPYSKGRSLAYRPLCCSRTTGLRPATTATHERSATHQL